MSYYGEATDSIYHFDMHSTLLIYTSSSANLHNIWTVDANATTIRLISWSCGNYCMNSELKNVINLLYVASIVQ